MRVPRSRWPALVVLAVLCGVGLATVTLPAAAQTATVGIHTLTPRCGNSGTSVGVYVAGSTNSSELVVQLFSPSGVQMYSQRVFADGGWSHRFSFTPAATGFFEVRATVGSARASGFIEVPCQPPSLEFDPTCYVVGSTTSVRITGRHFSQFSYGYLAYDGGGAQEQSLARIPIDGRGVFSVTLKVQPTSADGYRAEAYDLDQNVAPSTLWPRCVPTTTTTTSTSTPTSTPSTTTTQPDDGPVPGDDPAPDEAPPTTPPAPDTPGTPVTIPPTIDLPPPTPGATLTVAPELGPAGFVTGAKGTGFPPGPVTVTWQPGIGATTAIAGPDGTFTTRMLVFPNDRLGPRAIIAVAGATTAYDAFLVVQSSVQPSGQNVQQINRIRRFNQR